MNLKKTATYILVTLYCTLLIACSGGGGGSDNSGNDPASGNNWDQMEWDKGSWS